MSGRGGKREGAGRPSGSKDKRTNVQSLSIDDLKAIVSKLEELGEGLGSLSNQQVDQLIYGRLLLQASQGDFKSQQLVLDRYVKRAGTKDKHEIQPLNITKNADPYSQVNELTNEIISGNVDLETAVLLERLIVKRSDLATGELKSNLSQRIDRNGKVIKDIDHKRTGEDGLNQILSERIVEILATNGMTLQAEELHDLCGAIEEHNNNLHENIRANKPKGVSPETVRLIRKEMGIE